MKLREKTLKIRHGIVKVIAPYLYKEYLFYKVRTTGTPRPMILFLKNRAKGKLVGAEIGVEQGKNALSILTELPIQKLFLIDPYKPYCENGVLRYDASWAKEVMLKNLSKFSNFELIEDYSDRAVQKMPESLDFVYVDGDHSYEWVKRDIENYYPLVKPNGVFGGHDYLGLYMGLIQAVNEFAMAESLRNFHLSYPDWWIVKETIDQ